MDREHREVANIRFVRPAHTSAREAASVSDRARARAVVRARGGYSTRPRVCSIYAFCDSCRRSAKLNLVKLRMQYGPGLLLDDVKRCVT